MPLEAFGPLSARGGGLRRRAVNVLAIGACVLAAAVILLPLALIVWHLAAKGLPAFRPSFFLHMPKPVGEAGGGMANAIVGTLILVGLGALIAVPVGVGTGVYLAEYGGGRMSAIVRYTADLLAGVPSIVVGVAAYGLVVVPMGRFSAIAGGVALGILMLPTIVRTTEEVVRLVPQSYRHAALALGAPRWRVLQSVVVPAAWSGIATAIMLALARAAGETAPLLLISSIYGNSTTINLFGHAVPNIPVYIFTLSEQADPTGFARAWGASLVLLAFILLSSLGARALLARSRAKLTR